MARPDGSRVALGRLVTAAGIVETLAGAAAWMAVRSQLSGERIVVPSSAQRLANRPVQGPLTAFEQAAEVRRIALTATGGRSYGEMAEEDPLARMALEAALIRSSLFTSVLAFGVAGSQIAIGALFVFVGMALSRTSVGPPT